MRNITLNYGNLSVPFLNYYLENKNNYDTHYYYFKGVRSIYDSEYEKALYYFEKVLKNPSKTYLFHMARIKMVVIYDFLKDFNKASEISVKIKEDINNMTKNIRNLAYISIMIHKIETGEFSDFVDKIQIDRKLYNTYSKAPWGSVLVSYFLEKGEIDEAIKMAESTFKYSRKIINPSNVINSLNNLSWNLRSIDVNLAYYYSKKALYYCGYYFEPISRIFNSYDTFWEVIKNYNSDEVLTISENIRNIEKMYSKNKYKGFHKKYKKTFSEARNFEFIHNKNQYVNDKKLLNFLNKKIHNVSKFADANNLNRANLNKILNNNVKKINGTTIKKILKGIKIDNYFELPHAIINELIKEIVLKKEPYYKIIFTNDFLKDISLIGNKNKHISYIISNFEKARFDLGDKFLSIIKDKKTFLNRYYKLSNSQKKLFVSFARNYMRYVKIAKMINMEYDISNKIFDLEKDAVITTLYCYSNKKRKNILNILDFLKI